MKKNEVLEIHFQAFDDFKNEVRRSLAKRKPLIQSKNHIFFESVETFRKFMTIQKIELLTAIAILKPSSIYELAKMVDRDFAAVLRDCTSLEGTGFIRLKNMKGSKNTKAPELSFGYDCIAIKMPKSSYQIEFKSAA